MEVSGQKRHGWLHVLLWVVIAFVCIIPAGTTTLPGKIADAVELPPSLRQWDSTSAFPSTEGLRAFKRGVDNFFDKRYQAALESLPDEQAAGSLGDYILFYRAKANLMLERHKDALADFRRLESRYPDSPLVRESLQEQCDILLTLKEIKPALAILANQKIGTGSEVLYYQARASDLAGEKEKSIELYLQIYSRYPSSKYAAEAERVILSSSKGALQGARNYDTRLQRAESLIRENNYKSARTLLLALGRVSAPSSQSSEKRNLLFGEVQYRLGKTSAAIPSFHKVTAANPALHAKALYLEGQCYRKLEREQDFIALRDRLLKLYPHSTEAEELCYSVATYFDVNYEQTNARDAYGTLYEAFPKGRYAERALWKLALFPYFSKNYAEAALGFWKYLLAYPDPDSAGPAMYWMGRCYEKLGGTANAKYLFGRARALMNESYYGQRAREAEKALGKAEITHFVAVPGIDYALVTSTCDPIELPPVVWSDPGSPGTQVIERARQLVAAGMPDLGLTELRYGRSRFPQDARAISYVMARIYYNRGDYYEAISSLRGACPSYNQRPTASMPSEVWEILFPVLHWETISGQASKAGVDPTLVLGVIRQESSFEEKARSKANARGLMQILPSTGRTLARGARVVRYNPKKLYQADTNIILGTRFLDSLLQEYGKPELALAAYNAGKSRVDRWKSIWGDLDMAEFVEQIPFSETRGYVKQILSNRVRYGLLTSSAH